MRRAIAAAGHGQLLVPSFQGSRVEGMSTDDYIADHVTTARLVCETGAGTDGHEHQLSQRGT